MTREIAYAIETDSPSTRVRVRFSTSGAAVTALLVPLEALDGNDWKPVQRVDDAHGRPHGDYLDRRGREYKKVWLDIDRNTALTLAIHDLGSNWERYVSDVLQGRHP